jgi:phosphoserine phosphatase
MIRGLALFDLDGTLLRHNSACEVLAAGLGRTERMRIFEGYTSREEITAARREMLDWYRDVPESQLRAHLENATLAPHAAEGLDALRGAGIEVVIATITWRFAAEWIAEKLGVEVALSTGIGSDGTILHVWPHDKERLLLERRAMLGLPVERVAAVGDSRGDLAMLRAAGIPVFVGRSLPEEITGVRHLPDADILDVARHIIARMDTAR